MTSILASCNPATSLNVTPLPSCVIRSTRTNLAFLWLAYNTMSDSCGNSNCTNWQFDKQHLMAKRLGMPLPGTTNAQTNVCTNGWTMQKHNVSSHILDKWRHKNRITWPVNIQFQTLQTILLHQTVPNKLSALFLCQLISMPLNKQTNTRLTALFPGQPR